MYNDIKTVLRAIHDKYHGQIKPLGGLETTTFFSFFMVNESGEALGNSSRFIVTKDGKICDFVVMGVTLPAKYRSDYVKDWSQKELDRLWRALS